MKASPITLETLNKKIKGIIKDNLDSQWVIAEISELSINYSGHCYLELVQKSEKSEKLIARMRAVIWSNTFRMLKPYFETTTGHTFSEGIKVMLRVAVEFHEVYGLSLNVIDIEPTYTVGELTIRKQKILEKLSNEGVIDMNRELELPYFFNRIAILSSKTAAGLGDFQNQLNNNSQGYKFYTKLFPAIMQGNEAESSIINQLDHIFQHSDLFDAVVIIRGGGASADLECFNSYWLAYNITQFPLPILSGIGHEQDDTVVDEVAHTRLKTPTAVAEFLINNMSEVEGDLLLRQSTLIETTKDIIQSCRTEITDSAFSLYKQSGNKLKEVNKSLNRIIIGYSSGVKHKLKNHQKTLDKSTGKLVNSNLKLINNKSGTIRLKEHDLNSAIKLNLTNNKHRLDKIEQYIQHSDPKNVLRKGYSITLKNGKSIKDASNLKKGDIIESIFHKGKKKSTIN